MNTQLIALLTDSLALWQVAGTVEVGNAPVVAVIRASNQVVFIEQNTDGDVPWRWFVRWRDANTADERSRPCAALTGMLNAVRRALCVERGSAVRIAPAAPISVPSLASAGQG